MNRGGKEGDNRERERRGYMYYKRPEGGSRRATIEKSDAEATKTTKDQREAEGGQ